MFYFSDIAGKSGRCHDWHGTFSWAALRSSAHSDFGAIAEEPAFFIASFAKVFSDDVILSEISGLSPMSADLARFT